MKIDILSTVELKNGKFVMNGPMSPVLSATAANRIFEKEKMVIGILSHICRIWFTREHTLQINEGTLSKPEYTGMDTLMLIYEYKNGRQFVFIQDQGSEILCIGTFFNDEDEMSFTNIYS